MKQLKKDYEKAGFLLLLLIMAVYYGYRLFALTPWYDELYTYYFFISRGPVYSAIHWPVPNNHVGYSVLSAFFDYLGNPYIGLRGISYLCALANMILLFVIGRNYLEKGLSLAAVILYVSMNLVNQLAVQGRGYTLGITCYLTAFFCLIRICREGKCKRRYYILFAISLILGLYTLTSDVYFVLPVCFAGGIYLLYRGIVEKREKGGKLTDCGSFVKLIKLILSSVFAAVVTIGLYSVIWLAIGSNLLVKDESGVYFGMGHIQMILKAPFDALFAGMEYMLATPYIQSVEREGFLPKLFDWFLALFNQYYDKMGTVLFVLILAAVVTLMTALVRGIRKKEKDGLLFPLFLLAGILCMPLFLIIQCTLPYYRVFAYGGVLLSFSAVFLVQEIMIRMRKIKCSAAGSGASNLKLSFPAAYLFLFFSIGLSVFCFAGKGYQNQYGMREYNIQDALAHGNIEQAENICVTDCTQQYLMKFLYDITCENMEVEGTDFLLLDKKMLDPDYREMEWEFYHYYNTIPWDYVDHNMKQIYENEGFVLYIKNV